MRVRVCQVAEVIFTLLPLSMKCERATKCKQALSICCPRSKMLFTKQSKDWTVEGSWQASYKRLHNHYIVHVTQCCHIVPFKYCIIFFLDVISLSSFSLCTEKRVNFGVVIVYLRFATNIIPFIEWKILRINTIFIPIKKYFWNSISSKRCVYEILFRKKERDFHIGNWAYSII